MARACVLIVSYSFFSLYNWHTLSLDGITPSLDRPTPSIHIQQKISHIRATFKQAYRTKEPAPVVEILEIALPHHGS